VEVMDEENTQKDRTMGQLEIAASEYVQLGDDGQYLIHDSKDRVITAQVRIGNSPPKGTINFTVAFYPCLNVIDPEDEEREEEKGRQSLESTPKTPVSGKAPSLAPSANGKPGHLRTETATTINSVVSAKSTQSQAEMRRALEAGEQEQTETDEVKEATVPKIRIGPEDLQKYGKHAHIKIDPTGANTSQRAVCLSSRF
jgi:Ca2+-dependent lipid-binding protein